MTNVLLATSNGTGMGHLTRQVAVALALGDQHQPTLFSLSVGLPLATTLGIRGEYCPSYDRPWIAARDWHAYLRDRLVAIVEETGAEVVLFDGVAPYPGLGQATTLLRDVAFAWLRRGMWRDTSRQQLRKRKYFDIVIEPEDLAGDADRGPTAGLGQVHRVAPISLTEVVDALPRDQARQALGLPIKGDIALVTLGSGRLGDVAGPGEVAVQALLQESAFHVAVTSPAVSENQVQVEAAERMTEIRGVFPLVSYLNAFDVAVSSAGYNAVHELVPSGLPTLFIANTSTQTDDQVARSSRIAQLGLGLHAADKDPESVATGVMALLDESRRDEIAQAAAGIRPRITGAAETARLVASFGAGFTRRRRRPAVVLSSNVQQMKDHVKEALGEQRTATLKRLMGRTPTPMAETAEVRLVDQPQPATERGPLPLAVTETLTIDHLRTAGPVEHLLPGSGPEHRRKRLGIVHRYYQVAD